MKGIECKRVAFHFLQYRISNVGQCVPSIEMTIKSHAGATYLYVHSTLLVALSPWPNKAFRFPAPPPGESELLASSESRYSNTKQSSLELLQVGRVWGLGPRQSSLELLQVGRVWGLAALIYFLLGDSLHVQLPLDLSLGFRV